MSLQKKASRLKQRPSKVKAFGNLDTEQKYPITQDAIDAERYVLLHYSHIKETDPNNPQKPLDTGIIDTRTFTYGIYTPSTYDEYVREDEKTGKVNTFNKIKDKYIILHDPTIGIVEDDNDNDFDDNEKVVDYSNQAPVKLTKAELLAQLEALEDDENNDQSGNESNQDGNENNAGDDNQSDNEPYDYMSHTKAELLEMLNGTEATDEELHTAALPATNKAKIIELITKYKQA